MAEHVTAHHVPPPEHVACDSEIFQAVRIIDVFWLGPAMIRAGRKIGGVVGSYLAIAGVATIIFNGITFLDIERVKE